MPNHPTGHQTPAEFAGGTAETSAIYHYPLPNQYSHNLWYRKRGQVTVA